MMLADKTGSDTVNSVLDALAELSAVRSVLGAIGVRLKPATHSGPQYAEWSEFVRFHDTLLQLSIKEHRKEDERRLLPDTLAEVTALSGY